MTVPSRLFRPLVRRLPALVLAVATLVTAAVAAAAEPLRRYDVDLTQTSVSGISSGGYMAVQFGVAYSSIVRGVGAVAGGPYGCANASVTTALDVCMAGKRPIRVSDLVALTKRRAASGAIDPLSGLAGQRVWIFAGNIDSTVVPRVGEALERYYRAFVPAAALTRVSSVRAEHTMPTLDYGNDCAVKGDPYISDCDYDGAGALLQWIYGALNQPATTPPTGHIVAFDQSEFADFPAAHSLGSTGWVYVPAACEDGARRCRLHVAFHGCRQFADFLYVDGQNHPARYGTTFVEHAGYNRWADANDFIVLYPQTQRGPELPGDLFGLTSANPKGCWDWWAYDSTRYAEKTGPQMLAVRRMIARIAGEDRR